MLLTAAPAQPEAVLNAAFTPVPIQVDGAREAAWDRAIPSRITICANANRSAELKDCKASASVQALWRGPALCADDAAKRLGTDPYLDAGTYDRYYGGLKTMMPWAGAAR